jgi:hypothetical protein
MSAIAYRERLKTILLLVLVLLSLSQFYHMIYSAAEPAQQLFISDNYKEAVNESGVSFTPDILATPIRIIAHCIRDENSRSLLRSNVVHFSNIWQLILGVFTAHDTLDVDEIQAAPRSLWDINKPSIELILFSPMQLFIYLDLIGVELAGDEAKRSSFVVDRFYLSAEINDRVLFSDGRGAIYALPFSFQAQVLYGFLEITSRGVPLIQIFDIAPFGLVSSHEIYQLSSHSLANWMVSPELNAERFEMITAAAFSGLAAVRVDYDSQDLYFEDNMQRLTLRGFELMLEQTRSIMAATEGTQPIWREAAAYLDGLTLLPQESFYFDGFVEHGSRQSVFMQQARNGRPVFFAGSNDRNEPVLSSLYARGRNSGLLYMRYRPLRLPNISDTVTVLSLPQIIRLFLDQFPVLPYSDEALPMLRDIYEGFLVREGMTQTTLVWVIEFVDGRRYFMDMVSGSYLGFMPPPAER